MLLERLSVKFPPDLAELVRAQAEAEDRSVSAVIRQAVRASLAVPFADGRVGAGDATRFEERTTNAH